MKLESVRFWFPVGNRAFQRILLAHFWKGTHEREWASSNEVANGQSFDYWYVKSALQLYAVVQDVQAVAFVKEVHIVEVTLENLQDSNASVDAFRKLHPKGLVLVYQPVRGSNLLMKRASNMHFCEIPDLTEEWNVPQHLADLVAKGLRKKATLAVRAI